MTDTTRSGADLDARRRRARFRAWHRGMREMDLVLGRFADAQIAALSEGELGEFETLLEIPDTELLKWLTGATPVPRPQDTPLLRRIMRTDVLQTP